MNYKIINVLDHGFVSLVDFMGNDDSIVAAARVSLLGKSKGQEADLKLLKYLYDNRHTTPFEMVEFKFHVRAPIFVIREWQRHRTWSYNEQSGRYMVFDIQRYTPEFYRMQDAVNKQSSYGEIKLPNHLIEKRDLIRTMTDELYEDMLAAGIAKEMARIDFTISTYSEFFAKVDAHNLLHFLRLRLGDSAQYEIRVYARAMMHLVSPIIPHTISLFRDEISNKSGYNWINDNDY
jgi:thymidylate synthase (FAD)